ncbi:hypothetical protein AAAW43_003341 [Cronobacter sakazakii]
MEFLIALIIFGASVAVYKDAITNNIARPARWGIGSAFIFFIVIPLYLFKRKKLIGSALSESDDASSVQGGKNVREGANKQVISSQADSLIKISRIWADFFPANTSNQPI